MAGANRIGGSVGSGAPRSRGVRAHLSRPGQRPTRCRARRRPGAAGCPANGPVPGVVEVEVAVRPPDACRDRAGPRPSGRVRPRAGQPGTDEWPRGPGCGPRRRPRVPRASRPPPRFPNSGRGLKKGKRGGVTRSGAGRPPPPPSRPAPPCSRPAPPCSRPAPPAPGRPAPLPPAAPLPFRHSASLPLLRVPNSGRGPRRGKRHDVTWEPSAAIAPLLLSAFVMLFGLVAVLGASGGSTAGGDRGTGLRPLAAVVLDATAEPIPGRRPVCDPVAPVVMDPTGAHRCTWEPDLGGEGRRLA